MKPFYFSAILIFAAFFSPFPSFAGIYQAETADLYKAVTETKNSGFLGESYINFDNEPGSFLEIQIYLPDPDFSMIGYAAVPGEGVGTTTGCILIIRKKVSGSVFQQKQIKN